VGIPSGDRGGVTAETAVALPSLLLVAAVLIAGLGWIAGSVRCQDAAGHLARAVARGESDDAVEELARGLLPRGARHRVAVLDDQVAVEVSLPRAAAPWARMLPAPVATVVVPAESVPW
jgi:regulation of enolase protein 1 (concanavalin A-like superfamily)